MKNLTAWSMVVLAVVAACGSRALAAQAADSKIESVIVYRGQALVTRLVTLPAQAGELELIVGELPAQILPASLSASGSDGIAVRAVRYRAEASASAAKKEVAEIDEQIKQLREAQEEQKQLKELLKAKAAYVGKLEGFTASTASVEMGKGVLDTKVLTEVSQYILTQREELTTEQIKLNREARRLSEELALLQRKRSQLTRGAGKTNREAVVFLTRADDKPGSIRLTYLVGSASWSPAYNVRLDGDGKTVTVEYLAEVSQMSGEDWSAVKLTLSTATPAMNSMTPILAPLWMEMKEAPAAGPSGKFADKAKVAELLGSNAMSQRQSVAAWSTHKGNMVDANWALNRLATEQQDMEFNVKAELLRRGRGEAADVLAVSYGLPGPMSLASRSDRQLVQIDALKLAGTPYYQAIPILSNYVYRNVRVRNTTSLPLLRGPCSAYIGNDFVGKGRMPLVARGEEVTIGFGVDTQLRCKRELVEKSERTSWGSRVQSFHYRLRLESFKDSPVTVRVFDRIPACKGEGLTVSLGKLSDELSADPEYVRDDRKRGILRWDIRLQAGVRDVEYDFEMKFPKGADVGRLASPAMGTIQMDFERAAKHIR